MKKEMKKTLKTNKIEPSAFFGTQFTSTSSNVTYPGYVPPVEEDVCHCEDRCKKCGKKKRGSGTGQIFFT